MRMGNGGWKRVVLDRNMERFVRIKGFLHIKRRLLRAVKSCSNKRCFSCENERFLRAVRKLSVNEKILACEKGRFSAHAKQPDKEKTFFSAQRHQFPTATKLTCNCKFHPRQPTVSLQYNIPFSKLRNLASAV